MQMYRPCRSLSTWEAQVFPGIQAHPRMEYERIQDKSGEINSWRSVLTEHAGDLGKHASIGLVIAGLVKALCGLVPPVGGGSLASMIVQPPCRRMRPEAALLGPQVCRASYLLLK